MLTRDRIASLNDLAGLANFSDVAKSAWITDDGSNVFCVPMASVIHGFIYNKDIFKELEKPGRDPRPEFKTASFADGVNEVKDLVPGMLLEGVVTNVAAFGAFVDIGVHQDGLVHVSALANRFVKDPHEVVKAGQIVKVKVLEVDVKRQRIALTMRLTDNAESRANARTPPGTSGKAPARGNNRRDDKRSAEPQNAMALAFAKLKQK